MRQTYGGWHDTREAAQDALESYCAAGEISEGERPAVIKRAIRLSKGLRARYFVEIDS